MKFKGNEPNWKRVVNVTIKEFEGNEPTIAGKVFTTIFAETFEQECVQCSVRFKTKAGELAAGGSPDLGGLRLVGLHAL